MTRSSALVSISSLLASAAVLPAVEARSGSTKEERAEFVALVRLLERDPLAENANATRQQLRQWVRDVPDIRFDVCPALLDHALGAEYPYSHDIGLQIMLSGAVLTIQHPGEARNDVAVYTAGVEGALRAYEVLVRSRPDAQLAALDDLLDERRRGELRDHVARLAKAQHCKRGNERFIAAPVGAAAGLLLALLVNRWLGRWNGGLLSRVRAHARAAMILRTVVFACAAYYVVAGAALHFLEPEYDPRYFPMSHYAWGGYGWLMTSTFFVLGLALLAVAVGVIAANPPSGSTRSGASLLLIGALFVCLAGVFRTFPLHDIASAVALPSVAMAVLVVSWSFRQSAGRQALGLAGGLIAAAMFTALLSIVFDVGMPGLQQRAFLLLLLLWLSLVATRLILMPLDQQNCREY